MEVLTYIPFEYISLIQTFLAVAQVKKHNEPPGPPFLQLYISTRVLRFSYIEKKMAGLLIFVFDQLVRARLARRDFIFRPRTFPCLPTKNITLVKGVIAASSFDHIYTFQSRLKTCRNDHHGAFPCFLQTKYMLGKFSLCTATHSVLKNATFVVPKMLHVVCCH